MPNLPVTVDYDFYLAVAHGTSEAFADSYLSGAELHEGRLLPRTQTAWERLKESYGAKEAMRKHQVTMIKPPLFDPMKNVQLARAA